IDYLPESQVASQNQYAREPIEKTQRIEFVLDSNQTVDTIAYELGARGAEIIELNGPLTSRDQTVPKGRSLVVDVPTTNFAIDTPIPVEDAAKMFGLPTEVIRASNDVDEQ